MLLALTSIGGKDLPVLVNIDEISSVQVGWHGAAAGGGHIGRIWLRGNLSSTPDFMVEETVEQIEKLIAQTAAVETLPKGAKLVAHRIDQPFTAEDSIFTDPQDFTQCVWVLRLPHPTMRIVESGG